MSRTLRRDALPDVTAQRAEFDAVFQCRSDVHPSHYDLVFKGWLAARSNVPHSAALSTLELLDWVVDHYQEHVLHEYRGLLTFDAWGFAQGLIRAWSLGSPSLETIDAPPVARPEDTGVGRYCAPGPAHEQAGVWLLRFEDKDREECHYDTEEEAREAFSSAEAHGWNCHLFAPALRVKEGTPPVEILMRELKTLAEHNESLHAELKLLRGSSQNTVG